MSLETQFRKSHCPIGMPLALHGVEHDSLYVSDAETALAAIGRPAIVVGHSLGACVAGVLSQTNPNVRAVFLEAPPWFLGRPEEWGRSILSKLFSILLLRLTTWQQQASAIYNLC